MQIHKYAKKDKLCVCVCVYVEGGGIKQFSVQRTKGVTGLLLMR